MPTCVAVTCWGWGDLWAFGSAEEARLHPLIDSCDLVLSEAADVPRNWNYLFLPRFIAEVLGDRGAADRLTESIRSSPDERVRDQRIALAAQEIWTQMLGRARVPPQKPATICEMIVRDRRRCDDWHHRENVRRKSVTDAQTQTKPAAEAKPKTIAGKAPTAKIAFGKDKEGKAYGKDNNPKRAGSASADRFNLYKAGQTLQEATDAGCSAADLKWDLDHGFITAS